MKSIYFVWVILSRNYKSKLKTQMDSFQYPVQVSWKEEPDTGSRFCLWLIWKIRVQNGKTQIVLRRKYFKFKVYWK